MRNYTKWCFETSLVTLTNLVIIIYFDTKIESSQTSCPNITGNINWSARFQISRSDGSYYKWSMRNGNLTLTQRTVCYYNDVNVFYNQQWILRTFQNPFNLYGTVSIKDCHGNIIMYYSTPSLLKSYINSQSIILKHIGNYFGIIHDAYYYDIYNSDDEHIGYIQGLSYLGSELYTIYSLQNKIIALVNASIIPEWKYSIEIYNTSLISSEILNTFAAKAVFSQPRRLSDEYRRFKRRVPVSNINNNVIVMNSKSSEKQSKKSDGDDFFAFIFTIILILILCGYYFITLLTYVDIAGALFFTGVYFLLLMSIITCLSFTHRKLKLKKD